MKRRRGSLYLMVLMMTCLLLVMGMAYLSSQGPEAQASKDTVDAAQAYELARAGVEEARLKLAKDDQFPPLRGLETQVFTYSETLHDGSRLVGTYRVEVDISRAGPPDQIFAITSRGYTGKPGDLGAEAEIRCWLAVVDLEVVRWDE